MGYVIIWEKSSLVPSQTIEHLGLTINSLDMTVRIGREKCNNIIDVCKKVKAARNISIRTVARLLGTMTSYLPGVENGLLHYRALEACKNVALKRNEFNFDKSMTFNSDAKEDISWWQNNVAQQCTKLNRGPPVIILTTDSSMKGWGAVRDDNKTGGSWNADEQTFHINALEMKAVLFGLKSLCSEVSDSHIQVKTDSSTCVSYINARGGAKSIVCNEMAKAIWDWCLYSRNFVSAVHLAGVLNSVADFESRHQTDNTEWS